MILVAVTIVLFIMFIFVMLAVTGGIVFFSADNFAEVNQVQNEATPKAELKAYIDLNGNFIELLSKAEITKAKKDGFKVVWK